MLWNYCYQPPQRGGQKKSKRNETSVVDDYDADDDDASHVQSLATDHQRPSRFVKSQRASSLERQPRQLLMMIIIIITITATTRGHRH